MKFFVTFQGGQEILYESSGGLRNFYTFSKMQPTPGVYNLCPLPYIRHFRVLIPITIPVNTHRFICIHAFFIRKLVILLVLGIFQLTVDFLISCIEILIFQQYFLINNFLIKRKACAYQTITLCYQNSPLSHKSSMNYS